MCPHEGIHFSIRHSSDDANSYFAAFDWVAQKTGTYVLRATSFESVDTGNLVVGRD